MLAVGRHMGGRRYEIIGMNLSYVRKDVWVKGNLEPGEYFIYTNVFENLHRDN